MTPEEFAQLTMKPGSEPGTYALSPLSVSFAEMPEVVIHARLSAECDWDYSHYENTLTVTVYFPDGQWAKVPVEHVRPKPGYVHL